MNPTSTGGSQIQSDGVRKVSSMKSGEPCGLSFFQEAVDRTAAGRKGWRYRARVAASALTLTTGPLGGPPSRTY